MSHPRSFVGRAPDYRCAGLTQGNQTTRFGILDGLVFATPDAGPSLLVFDHENVEGGL
jgi:hypothetical protein